MIANFSCIAYAHKVQCYAVMHAHKRTTANVKRVQEHRQ